MKVCGLLLPLTCLVLVALVTGAREGSRPDFNARPRQHNKHGRRGSAYDDLFRERANRGRSEEQSRRAERRQPNGRQEPNTRQQSVVQYGIPSRPKASERRAPQDGVATSADIWSSMEGLSDRLLKMFKNPFGNRTVDLSVGAPVIRAPNDWIRDFNIKTGVGPVDKSSPEVRQDRPSNRSTGAASGELALAREREMEAVRSGNDRSQQTRRTPDNPRGAQRNNQDEAEDVPLTRGHGIQHPSRRDNSRANSRPNSNPQVRPDENIRRRGNTQSSRDPSSRARHTPGDEITQGFDTQQDRYRGQRRDGAERRDGQQPQNVEVSRRTGSNPIGPNTKVASVSYRVQPPVSYPDRRADATNARPFDRSRDWQRYSQYYNPFQYSRVFDTRGLGHHSRYDTNPWGGNSRRYPSYSGRRQTSDQGQGRDTSRGREQPLGSSPHQDFWNPASSVRDFGKDWAHPWRREMPSNVHTYRNYFFHQQHHTRPNIRTHSHIPWHSQSFGSRHTPGIPVTTSLDTAGPSYETMCRGRHYTARQYNETVWVSASVVNGSSMDALRSLKAYFMGENDRGQILAMLRPLRMTVSSPNGTISDTEATSEDFTLSAMTPHNILFSNPPTPLDPTLTISTEPAQVVYATHFRTARRAGTPAIYDEFFELQDALDSAREPFTRGQFHTAFYETWSDIFTGSLPGQARPGEILIPGGVSSSSSVVCTSTLREAPPQNGIKQCGRSKCPDYQHLAQLRDDIEMRRIRGATYVTRTAPACTILIPAITSQVSLKRYMAGANANSQHYSSTAPLFHHVQASDRSSPLSTCAQTITSAYMLPTGRVAAQPSERPLRIRTMADREVYVMKFEGRPTPRIVEQKVGELRRFLRREGHCFNIGKYMLAIYDHPFNRPPHLNEVMLFKRPNCQPSEDGAATASPIPSMTTNVVFDDDEDDDDEEIFGTTTAGIGNEVEEEEEVEDDFATEYPPLVDLPLSAMESNSVEYWDADFVPYRFSGNQTDFPDDFPTDVFVY